MNKRQRSCSTYQPGLSQAVITVDVVDLVSDSEPDTPPGTALGRPEPDTPTVNNTSPSSIFSTDSWLYTAPVDELTESQIEWNHYVESQLS